MGEGAVIVVNTIMITQPFLNDVMLLEQVVTLKNLIVHFIFIYCSCGPVNISYIRVKWHAMNCIFRIFSCWKNPWRILVGKVVPDNHSIPSKIGENRVSLCPNVGAVGKCECI